MQINILEAKNQLSQLVKRAQAGEEIVIAKRGQPVARLVATSASPHAGAMSAKGQPHLLAWLGEHPLPPHAQRSAAQIDEAIAKERQSWE